MAYCYECGNEIGDDFEYCPECGARQDVQPSTMKLCPKCGAEIPDDAIYCFECGENFIKIKPREEAQQVNAGKPVVYKNKWVSFFLCFFFGWLGIHRFYEGKVVTGLIYLFTLGLFGIGWIIDIIRILMQPTRYQV